LICFGVNPSTAEPNNLDPTLKSVARISSANGFDSWIMLNIYPQRSTNPDELHSQREYSLHEENMHRIKKIIQEYQPTIWAAWGSIITKRQYLINCLYNIVDLSKEYQCQWVNAGQVSKQGHPHHPLYLKRTAQLNSFDIDEYIKKASIKSVFSYIKAFENKDKYYDNNFYESLERAGFIDYDYGSKFTTAPINMDEELKRLKKADYNLTKALITGILREDHFSNGSFEKRVENGDVSRVLRKLRRFCMS